MPRTAKTLAITHAGKDVMLAGKTVSLIQQKEDLKKLRGLRVHPDYAEVSYQESDGHEQVFRFASPAAHEKRQKEITEHDAIQKKHLEAQRTFAPNQREATPPADKKALVEHKNRFGTLTAAKALLQGKTHAEIAALLVTLRAEGLVIDIAENNTPAETIDKILAANGYDLTEAPANDEAEATAESAKSEGVRKELLAKTRGEILKLAAEFKITIASGTGKAQIVDALLKSEEFQKTLKPAKVLNPDGTDPDAGPTVEEFVAASYNPSHYPPAGYNSKSTPEAIAAAITAWNATHPANP